MSSFDAEIAVLSATINTPSPEVLQEGAPPHVEFGVISGLALPVPNPQTGQPLVIPLGRLRFTFDRAQALEIFEAGLKAAQELPTDIGASDSVIVAHNMADVEAAAENIRRVTGI